MALGGKLIQVEICQLSLWTKTAACGKQLTSLDHTISEGNSVISDPAAQRQPGTGMIGGKTRRKAKDKHLRRCFSGTS